MIKDVERRIREFREKKKERKAGILALLLFTALLLFIIFLPEILGIR